MPVAVRCPNPTCAARFTLPDAVAGKAVKCNRCGTRIPASTDDVAETADSYSIADEAPTRRPADTAKAETVGRFVVRSRLGAGAFGTVYRAYDPQLDREVALKVPNANVLADAKRVERFVREAKAAANMRHPNIVPVFDAGKDGGKYYIAAAFIDGRSLHELVGKVDTDFRKAAKLVRELADALAYAHSLGTVHRDVKPHNCMVDAKGHLHLMDFGLARRDEDADAGPAGGGVGGDSKLTNDGAVMGTPSYMAPEQARGRAADIGPAADQYSAGVVLYELLTGTTPFHGPPAIVIFNVMNTDPDPPTKHRPDVPPDLEAICLKAMAKKPADRYPSCHALAADLRRFLDGEPVTARPPTAGEQLTRWARENRAIAGALAAAVGVFALAAVVAGWFAIEARQALGKAATANRDADTHLRKAEAAADEARAAVVRQQKAVADLTREKEESAKEKQAAEDAREKADAERKKTADALKEAQTEKARAEAAVADAKRAGLEAERLATRLLTQRAWSMTVGKEFAEAADTLRQCKEENREWEWRFLSSRVAAKAAGKMYDATALPFKPQTASFRRGGDAVVAAAGPLVSAGRATDRKWQLKDLRLPPSGFGPFGFGATRVEPSVACNPTGPLTPTATDAIGTLYAFDPRGLSVQLSGPGNVTRHDHAAEGVIVWDFVRRFSGAPQGINGPMNVTLSGVLNAPVQAVGYEVGAACGGVYGLSDDGGWLVTAAGQVARVADKKLTVQPQDPVKNDDGVEFWVRELFVPGGWPLTSGAFGGPMPGPPLPGPGFGPVPPAGPGVAPKKSQPVAAPTTPPTFVLPGPGLRWVLFARDKKLFVYKGGDPKVAGKVMPVPVTAEGKVLACASPNGRRVFVAAPGGSIQVLDGESWESVATLPKPDGDLLDLAFDEKADSLRAVTTNGVLASWYAGAAGK